MPFTEDGYIPYNPYEEDPHGEGMYDVDDWPMWPFGYIIQDEDGEGWCDDTDYTPEELDFDDD